MKKTKKDKAKPEEDITKQPWYKEWVLSREIWRKTGGSCFSTCVGSSPIPFRLAKKWFVLYDEEVIYRMVAETLNKERGQLAKTVKYILTLPKNHKHRKHFEKHLDWAIKNGKRAKRKLDRVWESGKLDEFKYMF